MQASVTENACSALMHIIGSKYDFESMSSMKVSVQGSTGLVLTEMSFSIIPLTFDRGLHTTSYPLSCAGRTCTGKIDSLKLTLI